MKILLFLLYIYNSAILSDQPEQKKDQRQLYGYYGFGAYHPGFSPTLSQYTNIH